MRRNFRQTLKLVLVTWIASVSTLLGIIFPLSLHSSDSNDLEVAASFYRDSQVVSVFVGNNSGTQRKLSANSQSDEKNYLTPRKHKVNPIDYDFILGANNVCGERSPYLLIVVPSVPAHFQTREAIRKTYGSFANDSAYNTGAKGRLNVAISLIFVLGNAKSQFHTSLIKNENAIYGDILQANFTDTYHNLTVKMLVALKWISSHCKGASYVLKIDEDVFVNIPHLVTFLKAQPVHTEGTIFGKLHVDHPVLREGRWAVSVNEFPLAIYPSYAAGNSYVISGHILPLMFSYSEYVPYLSMEDVFITGCLGNIVGARKINVNGFTWWDKGVPRPCAFYKTKQFTGNRITVPYMYKLWAVYVSYRSVCTSYRKRLYQKNMKLNDIMDYLVLEKRT